jgi:hypothetical protein
VEEVRRFVSSLALAAFIFCYFVPVSRATVCVEPKIKVADACGIVLDPSGRPIPDATVVLTIESRDSSVKTNDEGRFELPNFSGNKVEVKVTAAGFMGAFSSIGSVRGVTAACRKPIYIMLQVGGDGCTMISLKKRDLPIVKRD